MYWNILKRDIKRKKTMNVILLLFTILAAVFVASGLNNVVTVMNGTDYFFEKAGIKDYVLFTQNGDGGVEQILKTSGCVKDYSMEKCIWGTNGDITYQGEKLKVKNNTLLIQSLDTTQFHYFLEDNQELTEIADGEIYITAGSFARNDMHVGDTIRIQMKNTDKTFRVAGEIKDALLGSDLMGNTRLLLSENDFKAYEADKSLEPYLGRIFQVETDDTGTLSAELASATDILFSSERSTIRLSYVMDMILAMLVLVLSICLIIVSFVILKFVITFSIREEFREIGVMKAIGIRNAKIRRLYIVKYLAMAIVGGIVGFFVSIPFGNLLIASVSKKMVLGNEGGYLFNAIGVLAVIGLMVGFAYLCTGKVRKLTPVDAIRNGQTGERYHKKTIYRLSKSRARTPFYMALNDILSAPRRFITIVLPFFICSVFMLGVVMVTSTMQSKSMITCFGKESDIYITDPKMMKPVLVDKDQEPVLQENYQAIADELEAAGMPVDKVSMEVWYKYACEANGKLYSVLFQQNTETHTTDYTYEKGTPPQNAYEIAITPMIADQLGVDIRDTVTIDFGTEKRDCVVTALFQTMNQLGKVGRLHEEAPTSMKYSTTMPGFQVDFLDHPDEKEIRTRVKKIKELYGITGVFDAAGYCVDCMGVGDTMDTVCLLLLAITGIVVILVTVLMERSFISTEHGQIALLKAIGFSNRSIFWWHVIRFMLVAGFAEILAVVLTRPITKLWCDPIWAMMGAANVDYYFSPVKIILIYPGIVLAITWIAVSVTAFHIRRIRGTDIVNVE